MILTLFFSVFIRSETANGKDDYGHFIVNLDYLYSMTLLETNYERAGKCFNCKKAFRTFWKR